MNLTLEQAIKNVIAVCDDYRGLTGPERRAVDESLRMLQALVQKAESENVVELKATESK